MVYRPWGSVSAPRSSLTDEERERRRLACEQKSKALSDRAKLGSSIKDRESPDAYFRRCIRRLEYSVMQGEAAFRETAEELLAQRLVTQADVDRVLAERGRFMPGYDARKKLILGSGGLCTQGGHDPYR